MRLIMANAFQGQRMREVKREKQPVNNEAQVSGGPLPRDTAMAQTKPGNANPETGVPRQIGYFEQIGR